MKLDDHVRHSMTVNGFAPETLDVITDVVLAYKPKPKSKAAKRRIRKAKNQTRQGNESATHFCIYCGRGFVTQRAWEKHNERIHEVSRP
jgi:hypothetical protein